MNLLLREYLLSGDVPEAAHCLRQLEVPHFHHELIYEVGGARREGVGAGPMPKTAGPAASAVGRPCGG